MKNLGVVLFMLSAIFAALFLVSLALSTPTSAQLDPTPHDGEEVIVEGMTIPAGGDLSITISEHTGPATPIEPLVLTDRKVVEIPDAEGLWWFYVEHPKIFQTGQVEVGNLVGKPIQTDEDGGYSNEQLEAALTLQAYDWDFSHSSFEKRWMPVEEWAAQHRNNGGKGVIRCTPVLEVNPFDKAWRERNESEVPAKPTEHSAYYLDNGDGVFLITMNKTMGVVSPHPKEDAPLYEYKGPHRLTAIWYNPPMEYMTLIAGEDLL